MTSMDLDQMKTPNQIRLAVEFAVQRERYVMLEIERKIMQAKLRNVAHKTRRALQLMVDKV